MRRVTCEAFLLWLFDQPEAATWHRKTSCSCPLHDFIETMAGDSLSINSPELSEFWHERETQTWPTPWWMTYVMRAVDHCGEGRIGKDELLAIALVAVDDDFSGLRLPMSSEQLARRLLRAA